MKKDRFKLPTAVPDAARDLAEKMKGMDPTKPLQRVWNVAPGGFQVAVLNKEDLPVAHVHIPWPPASWRHYPTVWLAFKETGGRGVLITGAVWEGKPWLHLSLSRKDRCPSYRDLAEVKELFIPGLEAVQLFVPKERHINIHPFCLHLWAPVGHSPLPDFAEGGDTI